MRDPSYRINHRQIRNTAKKIYIKKQKKKNTVKFVTLNYKTRSKKHRLLLVFYNLLTSLTKLTAWRMSPGPPQKSTEVQLDNAMSNSSAGPMK